MSLWTCLDEGHTLLRGEYRFGNGGKATTLAFRLADGGLALLSPPGGRRDADALYDALREYGEVTAFIAPNGQHRLGMPAAEARFPDAVPSAPEDTFSKVGARLARPARLQPLSALQPRLAAGTEVFVPPHMRSSDTMARFQTAQGTAWLITDIYTNLDVLPPSPAFRLLLWMLRFRTGLAVNYLGCRYVLVDNQPAFSAWLQDALAAHPPDLLIPGHGPVIPAPPPLGPRMQAAFPRLNPSGA